VQSPTLVVVRWACPVASRGRLSPCAAATLPASRDGDTGRLLVMSIARGATMATLGASL
jgi:hypothetical protein